MNLVAQYNLFPQSDAAEAFRPRRRAQLLLLVILLAAVSLLIHGFTPASWNIASARAVQSVDLPGYHELMRWVSGFGNAPKVVFVTAIVLLACNQRAEALWLAFSGLGGWLLATQLKPLFASQRPSADEVAVYRLLDSGSFPSGHVVFYVCFFGFVFFLARERMTRPSMLLRGVMVMAAGLIALVGISRLFLGEHWLSDLPGSYLLGAIWLTLSVQLSRAWSARAPDRLRRAQLNM
jgi:undecaprenyl-diphosphatase